MQKNKEAINSLDLRIYAWVNIFNRQKHNKMKSFLSILIFLTFQSNVESGNFNGQQNNQQQRLNLIIASQNSSKVASNILSGTFSAALPFIQKSGNNSLLNAAIASEIFNNGATEIVIVGSLSIAGNVTLSGDNMTIALPTNINELVISGGVVTLKIPTGGSVNITVDGSAYTNPIPGLIVEKSLAANTFEIDGAVVLPQGFWAQTGVNVTISKSFLATTVFSSTAYISLDSASGLTVQEDITLNGADVGSVAINGNLSSVAGDILFKNNQTTNNVPGVLIGASILTSSSKSLRFIDNGSTQNDGILIDTAAKIQSGTVTFTGNFGNSANYGINIKGNVYTNQFNATTNCTTNNQELRLDHDIYQYSNPPAVPLSESQINIVNTGCGGGGGILTMTGSVDISGDTMTIALPVIGDIVITDGVVIKVPASGSVNITVDGSAYTDPIPGLTIISDQAANTFEIDGALVLSQGFWAQTGVNVTISKSFLATTVFSSTAYISLDSASVLTVQEDITLNGADVGSVAINGNLSSVAGDILFKNNQTTNNVPGVLIGASILTSSSKSLRFIDNGSTQNDGILIDTAAKIQSGTVTFTGNFGNSANYGINIKGNVYTSQFNATTNCTTNNQELRLDNLIYQYDNPPAVSLSESQINIVNTGCGGDTLAMTGSVTISGDTMTIALPAIGDIVITNQVVIKVPTSGSLAITVGGSAYTDPIPGLTIVSDQAANTFEVDGSLLVTAPSTGGLYTNIPAGAILTVAGSLTFNGGPNSSTKYGSVYNAGTITVAENITMNNNTATSSSGNVYGVYNDGGTITATSGSITMSGNTAEIPSGSGLAFGVWNSSSASITSSSGVITVSNNTATVTSGSSGAFGFLNSGTMAATEAIIISNNTAITSGSGNALGTWNSSGASITSSSGAITINNNTATSNTGFAYGVFNDSTITAASDSITMNNNTAETLGGGTAYGIWNNDGTITATSGNITMSDNTATSGSNEAYGAFNDSTIKAFGNITMNGNTATSDSGTTFGVRNNNDGTITATSGNITMSDNTAETTSGNAFTYGIWNNGGTITATSGSITMNGNTATSDSGSAEGILNYENATITATGPITMNGNTATSDSDVACGVRNDSTITTSGNITMNENIATSDSGSAYGVLNYSTITATGNITMRGNTAETTSSTKYGFISFGTVKTNGYFVITIVTTGLPTNATQRFNSNFTTITNSSNTALDFDQFTITINTDSYGSTGGNYATMTSDHSGVVILDNNNRT